MPRGRGRPLRAGLPRSGEQLLVGDFLDQRVVEREDRIARRRPARARSRAAPARPGARRPPRARSTPPPATAAQTPGPGRRLSASSRLCASTSRSMRALSTARRLSGTVSVCSLSPCSTTARASFAQEERVALGLLEDCADERRGQARAVGHGLDQRPALDLAQRRQHDLGGAFVGGPGLLPVGPVRRHQENWRVVQAVDERGQIPFRRRRRSSAGPPAARAAAGGGSPRAASDAASRSSARGSPRAPDPRARCRVLSPSRWSSKGACSVGVEAELGQRGSHLGRPPSRACRRRRRRTAPRTSSTIGT